MQSIRAVTLLLATALVAVSCSKNKEEDALAKAQQCLDQVPEGDYGAATPCLEPIRNYNSQQANILKCSIIMTSGGLMEDKIVAAYNALKDKTQANPAASFMSILALTYSTITDGYNKALQANQYCQATGVVGYEYIAGIVVAGTTMQYEMANLNIPIDPNDPSSVNTAVTNFLNTCGGTGPPDPTCTANAGTLGSAATILAGSYCSTSGANQQVCSQVNSAVSSAGSDPTAVGNALLCYMNKKTYNPTTQQCQ